MIHFALPTRRREQHRALPPVLPATYLRMRRIAAGLTVEALALRIDAKDVAEAKALVRLLETDGAAARYRETIEAFAAAMPIDVEVYLQLRDTPPHQHPRICRGCGCSQDDPCVAGDGTHACSLIGPAICTRCDETAAMPVFQ